jgi:ATP-dependent RNA helicase DeaD
LETFDQLTLDPALKRAISDLGYEKPSPIQAQALPILLGDNTDFIGLAATGTGKTAAFSIPLLERIDSNKSGVQALILCPTRELCLQVAGQVNLLGKYLNIHALPIYGGTGYEDQLRGLKKGVSVVVGTPGRVIDHLERGTLKLGDIQIAVLDEADEMISMGFREAMETILEKVPKDQANTWLFSATMSGAVRKVADQFLRSPKMVQVNRTEMLSATVEQYYYMTQEKNKPEVLCKLIDAAEDFYGVIFCQTKSLVVDLVRYLSERSYKVDCLHGDMSQAARETAMLAFREKRAKLLICTDVASRGLDVKDITHVVNYSLPRELDSYVHRIGRTARSGKTGLAMSLVTPTHRHLISKIERMTKSRFNEGTIPTRKAIGIKKISQLLAKFSDVKDHARVSELMGETWKETVSAMSADEVTGRFLALMFPWVFSEKEVLPQMSRSQAAPAGGSSEGRSYGGGGRDRDRGGPPRSAGRGGGYGSDRRAPRSYDRGPSRGPASPRSESYRSDRGPSKPRFDSFKSDRGPSSGPKPAFGGGEPRGPSAAPKLDRRPHAPDDRPLAKSHSPFERKTREPMKSKFIPDREFTPESREEKLEKRAAKKKYIKKDEGGGDTPPVRRPH